MTQTTSDDAYNRALAPSPKGMLEAKDNPGVLEEMARMDFYALMHRFRIKSAGGLLSATQDMEWGKVLMKVGKLEAKEVQQQQLGALPTINIIFPNSGKSTQIAANNIIDVTPDAE